MNSLAIHFGLGKSSCWVAYGAWCRASCWGPNVFWLCDSVMKPMLTRMCASGLPVVQHLFENLHWNMLRYRWKYARPMQCITITYAGICRHMQANTGNIQRYAVICSHMQPYSWQMCGMSRQWAFARLMQSIHIKYARICSHMNSISRYMHKYGDICKHMQAYADICLHMYCRDTHAYADICQAFANMCITYVCICSHMRCIFWNIQANADICRTYEEECKSVFLVEKMASKQLI